MLSLITRALAIGLIAAALVRPATAQIADIVFDNGKIITVDDRFTIAQAVAIRGQRIIAVGRTSDLSKFKGPQTQVIDLNGRTVIPGSDR
jgi:predicted amidohydrolase YtcJ